MTDEQKVLLVHAGRGAYKTDLMRQQIEQAAKDGHLIHFLTPRGPGKVEGPRLLAEELRELGLTVHDEPLRDADRADSLRYVIDEFDRARDALPEWLNAPTHVPPVVGRGTAAAKARRRAAAKAAKRARRRNRG